MSQKTPAPPDYTGVAKEQAQASKEVTNMQTWANRPTMVTPWGTSSWDTASSIDPATGQKVTNWTNNVTLDPASKASLDAQQGIQTDRSLFASNLLGNVQKDYDPNNQLDWNSLTQYGAGPNGGQLQRGISTDGLPQLDSSSKYQQQAGDAIYNQFASRADPRFARQKDDLQSRLYAQGLREGDTAFKNQMGDMANTQNDAYQQAAYQATIGSGAEAQRMLGMDSGVRDQMFGENVQGGQFANQAQQQAFGQSQTGANYNNQLRQQQIQEAYTKQNQNLNAMNALLTGQQVSNPQFNSFNQANASETPQLMDAAKSQYSASMDAFNAKQAGMNSMMSGLGSMGGAAMMSDRRLKTNIKPLGTYRGYPLYSFDYIWGESAVGVMADEVPEHMTIDIGEFKAVNYGLL